MKTILKLEESIKFIVSYLLTLEMGFQWWLFFALLLAPDVSMIGYLVNKKTGAVLYNIFHHQGLALLIAIAGFYSGNNIILFTGLLLFGHSSMDRIFGYGLKYPDDFKITHLGRIGNN